MESSEGWLKTIGGYGGREALFGNKFELNYFLCFEGWIENKQRSQEEWTQPKLEKGGFASGNRVSLSIFRMIWERFSEALVVLC